MPTSDELLIRLAGVSARMIPLHCLHRAWRLLDDAGRREIETYARVCKVRNEMQRRAVIAVLMLSDKPCVERLDELGAFKSTRGQLH